MILLSLSLALEICRVGSDPIPILLPVDPIVGDTQTGLLDARVGLWFENKQINS